MENPQKWGKQEFSQIQCKLKRENQLQMGKSGNFVQLTQKILKTTIFPQIQKNSPQTTFAPFNSFSSSIGWNIVKTSYKAKVKIRTWVDPLTVECGVGSSEEVENWSVGELEEMQKGKSMLKEENGFLYVLCGGVGDWVEPHMHTDSKKIPCRECRACRQEDCDCCHNCTLRNLVHFKKIVGLSFL